MHEYFKKHHTYFRDTISLECIVEDDCVRSCLVEFESFPLSKLYSDPIHRILVPFPLLLVRCKTWFGQIKLLRIPVILIHGIHDSKEYRLSVHARILSSRYNPEFVMEHIRCDKYIRGNRAELIHCPVMKDQ